MALFGTISLHYLIRHALPAEILPSADSLSPPTMHLACFFVRVSHLNYPAGSAGMAAAAQHRASRSKIACIGVSILDLIE